MEHTGVGWILAALGWCLDEQRLKNPQESSPKRVLILPLCFPHNNSLFGLLSNTLEALMSILNQSISQILMMFQCASHLMRSSA